MKSLAVLLLIGFSLLVIVRYRSDLHHARQHVENGSRIANTACGPIEYAVAGKSETGGPQPRRNPTVTCS